MPAPEQIAHMADVPVDVEVELDRKVMTVSELLELNAGSVIYAALMVALHIWAMAHGTASLFGRGDGAQRTLPMSPAELLEAQMLVYLRGLGVNSPRG